MTSKDYSKVHKQLKNKPAKWAKYQKHNKPKQRNYGKSVSKCVLSGSTRGVIRKYGLNLSRRTFREYAQKLGFKKLDWG